MLDLSWRNVCEPELRTRFYGVGKEWYEVREDESVGCVQGRFEWRHRFGGGGEGDVM